MDYKQRILGIVVGIIVLLLLLWLSTSLSKSNKQNIPASNGSEEVLDQARNSEVGDQINQNNANNNMQDNANQVTELKIEDLVVGTGKEAVKGANISVNYKGTLTNGTKFDSSYDRGTPFEFTLGVGQVIQGWDQGFEGMKVGGKRKLTIPSDLAYGPRAIGSIPANSVLIFEVELLDVKS